MRAPRMTLAVLLPWALLSGCKKPPAGGTSAGASVASSLPAPSVPAPSAVYADSSALAPLASAPPGAPTLTPASAGLPTVDFGAPGRLVVKGYPEPLQLGMADHISHVGYSGDGRLAIACGRLGPGGDTCFVHDGKATSVSKQDWDGERVISTPPGMKAAREALAGGQSHKLARSADALMPPPLEVSWRHASELTLETSAVAGALRLGGRVAGEAPVFSIALPVRGGPHVQGAMPLVNALVASPSGDELFVVAHFFCGEWCNEIVVERVGLGAIASLIYNDTGFRHHKKGAFSRARDLFLKATWADPRAPLPPYNLACAYALLDEAALAEKALRLAIALGGPKVKARARADGDLARLKGSPWFEALTAGAP